MEEGRDVASDGGGGAGGRCAVGGRGACPARGAFHLTLRVRRVLSRRHPPARRGARGGRRRRVQQRHRHRRQERPGGRVGRWPDRQAAIGRAAGLALLPAAAGEGVEPVVSGGHASGRQHRGPAARAGRTRDDAGQDSQGQQHVAHPGRRLRQGEGRLQCHAGAGRRHLRGQIDPGRLAGPAPVRGRLRDRRRRHGHAEVQRRAAEAPAARVPSRSA